MDRDYYQNVRSEIFPLIGKTHGDVLDMGGGVGATSRALKQAGLARQISLWDFDVKSVEDAGATREFDTVERVDLNAPATWPMKRRYDLILLLDVLEHLIDPWQSLRAVAACLSPKGEIIISLPNVRDVSVVAPLLLRGTWRYRDNGVLDRTHMRFFTRRSMVELLEGSNLSVVEVMAIRNTSRRWINALSLGLLKDFTAKQYAFRCVFNGEVAQ
jgi:2-polyprenyl-3-methyl-5-hydroxy-6-metoxy-1,4-benzoquinol methylase